MEYLEPILQAAAAILLIIALTRVNGLRSFAKMSSFDFVTTVAIGSVLASAITSGGKGFWMALIGLFALFLVQGVLSRVRMASDPVKGAMDNSPLMLMENGVFIDANLARAQIARSDVYAKLRAVNAPNLASVRAVVLETTGDVSVLHALPGDAINDEVLEGVIR